MAEIAVSELVIYPVKSLGAVSLSRMAIDDFGPARDRRFVIADLSGRFVTQREYARLALVRVTLHKSAIELNAQGMAPLVVNEGDAERLPRHNVVVWRDSVMACDMGDAAAAWLSKFIGSSVRLHYMPRDSVRQIDLQYAQQGDRVSFADGFPGLLIGAASVAEFNRALPAPLQTPAMGARFRPNIVVAGAEPYAEDSWRQIRIGSVLFDVVKPCSRCMVPSIDPQTGQKQAVVVQTLARLRRRDDAVYFGQNLIARGIGEIALGDAVEIIK